MLVRLRADGTPDPTFGDGGFALLPYTAPITTVPRVAFGADERLLVATEGFEPARRHHDCPPQRERSGGPFLR